MMRMRTGTSSRLSPMHKTTSLSQTQQHTQLHWLWSLPCPTTNPSSPQIQPKKTQCPHKSFVTLCCLAGGHLLSPDLDHLCSILNSHRINQTTHLHRHCGGDWSNRQCHHTNFQPLQCCQQPSSHCLIQMGLHFTKCPLVQQPHHA